MTAYTCPCCGADISAAVEKEITRRASAAGSVKSAAKSAASRLNGKKGGRPKKKQA